MNESAIAPSCRIRVSLLGPLEVARRTSDGWQVVSKEEWGKYRKAGRRILGRLLAAPGRRAGQGRLLEDLWPDNESQGNLHNGLTAIRQVIGEDLLTTRETFYEVAGQDLVWVDLDACQWLLRAAENQGGTTVQALAFLEEALSYLERGECFEEEEGHWRYGLQAEPEAMLRQCRWWLAQGYQQQGKFWQAGEQYRVLCTALPPNEEALRQWLEMLVQHGKRQEAVKCFQEVKASVEAQGLSLSTEMEGILLSLNQKPRRALNSPFQPLRLKITAQEDSQRVLLRRHLLLGLLGIPLLPLTSTPCALSDAEAYLAECQEQIRACWRLLAGKEISVAAFLLCSWLPSLEPLVARSSRHQQPAAHLAAQGSLLVGLIAILQRRDDAAERARRQAVDYAALSGDRSLQVAALKHLATQYDDLQCWSLQRRIYTQAFPLFADATPLLRSRIELGMALAEARLGEEHAARDWWEKAQESFPSYPEDHDPAYTYADCGRATFHHYGGLMYLECGQAEKAFDLLDGLRTSVPLRTENEITLCKVQAALALCDLDRTRTSLEAGLQGAVHLQCEMRLHDARKLYQQACTLWPNEPTLKTLEEHFH